MKNLIKAETVLMNYVIKFIQTAAQKDYKPIFLFNENIPIDEVKD